MDDKSALLGQLRIDRTQRPSARGTGAWIAAAVALLAVAAALVFWLSRVGATTIRVASPKPATAGSAAAAGSILDATGYVVARRQATVASKITAKMIELDIEEGDHVKAGQIIAKLDDTNIRAALNESHAQLNYAKAALAETEVNLANAQRDYDRQKSLLGSHFVSQAAVDNSQTTLEALRAQLATQQSNVAVVSGNVSVAERNLDDTVVRAPFSGVVTVKAAQPGEMVSPISAGGGFTRTGIGTVVDMDSLEIQVDVNENFINRVRTSQQVTAKLNAYPDLPIPAHVIAVIPTADRSKGTVTVRIALDQRDPRILPEMGVRVAFLEDAAPSTESTSASGLVLPANAVLGSGAIGSVFVVHGDSVEQRAVRLGAGGADGVLILSGLTAADRVAAGDLTALKDGARIRIAQ